MWFAVEGEPPFGGGEFQTLSAIVGGEPRPPRRLGPLAPVLDRLLAKDPARRPTPDELRPLLERVAAGSGAGRARGRRGAGPAAVAPARDGGDTPPVPGRARRRDAGTAVLGRRGPGNPEGVPRWIGSARGPAARPRRWGRRALPPVPPVPAPGEPILPRRSRRLGPVTGIVLAVLVAGLAAHARKS